VPTAAGGVAAVGGDGGAAAAAPLLPVLRDAKAGNVQVDRWAAAWMLESAIARVSGHSAAPDSEAKR
jgi:hypothetical protein